jgi:hypothetical protein
VQECGVAWCALSEAPTRAAILVTQFPLAFEAKQHRMQQVNEFEIEIPKTNLIFGIQAST